MLKLKHTLENLILAQHHHFSEGTDSKTCPKVLRSKAKADFLALGIFALDPRLTISQSPFIRNCYCLQCVEVFQFEQETKKSSNSCCNATMMQDRNSTVYLKQFSALEKKRAVQSSQAPGRGSHNN